MKSRWNDAEAAQYKDDLGLRVYTSRLLGSDPALVLHGGGNTSVKSTVTDLLGEKVEVLYVKGSGWDLGTIEAPGFPAVRMDHLKKLRALEKLADADMVNTQKTHMLDAKSPNPSIECLLHAFLPQKFIEHTHADAVVALTNVRGGEDAVREVYGDSMAIVPYVQPGFDLAKVCAEVFEQAPNVSGLILMKHGIFTFHDDAKTSYDLMIDKVDEAEQYLNDKKGNRKIYEVRADISPPATTVDRGHLMAIMSQVMSESGGVKLCTLDDSKRVLELVNSKQAAKLTQIGPATPDHVIRTKALPLYLENPDLSSVERFEKGLREALKRYIAAYEDYFNTHAAKAPEEKILLDPHPRVLLVPGLGMVTTGANDKDCGIVADIYRHTIDVLEWAASHGEYEVLTPAQMFDMEYWDLEQAKLRKGGNTKPPLAGRVAVVTGAASGIGRGAVEALLAQGAHVAGLDIDRDALAAMEQELGRNFVGLSCDVTDRAAIADALTRTACRFGRIDLLFANAGIFPKSCTIEEMEPDVWEKSLVLNLSAHLWTLKAATPYLKRNAGRADVIIMGSKNVPAPGPGAAAYSCAKAAVTQLGRVAALELAESGIRVNTIHPDAVFDTGVWTDEVLAARAAHYGMSVDEYKRKNLLKRPLSSREVGDLVARMCGEGFINTTGAQVPVDGGNDRVI